MKGFEVRAFLTRSSSRKDRGVGLSFTSSMEVIDKDVAIIHKCLGKEGWLLFSEDEITEEDIPKQPATDESKAPSQRLRAVLFKIFIQTGGKKEEFEFFYRDKMNEIINHFKAKLDL